MAGQDDVRRIALALPDTEESDDHFGFSVAAGPKRRQFAWAWAERVDPKRPRTPRDDVLAVRTPHKEDLLASDPEVFFTEAHYDGFPAVLVRLPAIGVDELAELITDAWRMQAPRAVVAAYDQSSSGRSGA